MSIILQTMTIANSLDALDEVARFILSVAARAELPQQTTYRLRLAVDEVVTNIITHGFTDTDPHTPINLSATIDDQQLKIELVDRGMPYDPQQILPAKETLHLPPQERPLGGLGFFLALWGVDAFHYKPKKDGNYTIFVIKRPFCTGSPAELTVEEPL